MGEAHHQLETIIVVFGGCLTSMRETERPYALLIF